LASSPRTNLPNGSSPTPEISAARLPYTDLKGIDVDAAAPDGKDVKRLRGTQYQPSEG
jgi:hypothetical protein